ncbi:MAG: hypothetical protein GKR89_10730 [Candidatus Latescibacteria bacterium]|nr:hypothetical protein [Candidatus Latescibacterota bacterium]
MLNAYPSPTTLLSILGGLLLILAPALSGQALPPEQHPSLLFTAAQVPLLQERLQRPPYTTWWEITQGRATALPQTFTEERTKARYAKSLAFVYTMSGDSLAALQAADLLLSVQFPPRGGDLGQPHLEGETFKLYLEAYDMLHSFLESEPEQLEEIRTIAAEEAHRLYDGIRIEIGSGLLSLSIKLHESGHLDNWHLRVYAALGLAALALADHPGTDGSNPQDWAQRALQMIQETLDYQTEETSGAFAEGPFYHRYAADVYLPYMAALKRLTGLDLFVDPKIERLHDWSLNLRLPNGRRPNIDDGHLDDFYGHYLAAFDADGGAHRWDWENNENGLYVREFSELDAIALYDDRIAAQEPDRGPTIFMPAGGDAVFRSDWSSQATYMLLRGEHDLPRTRGLAHEHPDETSFIIYAGGEMLALDAGYINFDNHHKVNQGHNHNVVLVDGEGPPLDTLFGQPIGGGNDAYIVDEFTSPLVDYAQVEAAYAGVQTRRRVAFVEGRYFVVADQLRDDRSHRYTWRLHGNGGGSSGGTYQRDGDLARWTRDKAELLAYTPTTDDRTIGESESLHSLDFLQELTHTVLEVERQGAQAEFLTLLFPRPLDQPEPLFSTPTAAGGQAVQLELEGQLDLAWVAAADTISVAGANAAFSSDGRFGLVRQGPESPTAYQVQDGHFLARDGAPVFNATQSIDLSLARSDTSLAGFVRSTDAGFVLSLPLQGLVDSLHFGGILLDTTWTADTLNLNLVGEGDLYIGLQPLPDILPLVQRADFDADGQVGFTDFFRFTDAFGHEEPAFDLDGNGRVALGDFLLFAEVFGQSSLKP